MDVKVREQWIPRCSPKFDCQARREELTEMELQLVSRLDGTRSVRELAELMELTSQELLLRIDLLIRKGILILEPDEDLEEIQNPEEKYGYTRITIPKKRDPSEPPKKPLRQRLTKTKRRRIPPRRPFQIDDKEPSAPYRSSVKIPPRRPVEPKPSPEQERQELSSSPQEKKEVAPKTPPSAPKEKPKKPRGFKIDIPEEFRKKKEKESPQPSANSSMAKRSTVSKERPEGHERPTVSKERPQGHERVSIPKRRPVGEERVSIPKRRSLGDKKEQERRASSSSEHDYLPPTRSTRTFREQETKATEVPKKFIEVIPPEEAAKAVSDIISLFERTALGFLSYDAKTSLTSNLLSALHSKLLAFLENFGELKLDVANWQLSYGSEVVYRNEIKGESVAFKLYRTGLRSLTFKKGLDWPELTNFLEGFILCYSEQHFFEDDLLTFWKRQDGRFIHYETFESLALLPFYDFAFKEREVFLDELLEGKIMEESFFSAFMKEEESSQRWLPDVQAKPVNYRLLPKEELQILKTKQEEHYLPVRFFRFLDYLEKEIRTVNAECEPVRFQHILEEYRDHLILKASLGELKAFLQRLTHWKNSSHPDILPLQQASIQLLDSFKSKERLQDLLESLPRTHDRRSEEERLAEVLEILNLFNYSHLPTLFELLGTIRSNFLLQRIRATLLALTKQPKAYIQALNGANVRLKRQLILCLEQLEGKEALEAIASQIDTEDIELQNDVLAALDRRIDERMGVPELKGVIFHLLASPNLFIRSKGYALIERSGDVRWATPLLDQVSIRSQISSDELRHILFLAALIDKEKTLSLLLKLAAPPSRFARESEEELQKRIIAVDLLGYIADENGEILLKELNKKMPALQEHCIGALRLISRRKTMPDPISEIRNLLQGQLKATALLIQQQGAISRESLEVIANSGEFKLDEEIDHISSENIEDPLLLENNELFHVRETLLVNLKKAGINFNDDWNASLREQGLLLLNTLQMLFKTARLYDAHNRIFDQQLHKFEALIASLLSQFMECRLEYSQGKFYFNRTFLPLRNDAVKIAQNLAEEFDKMEICGLQFLAPFNFDEAKNFITLFRSFAEEKAKNSALQLDSFVQNFRLRNKLRFLLKRTSIEEEGFGENLSSYQGTLSQRLLEHYLTAIELSRLIWQITYSGHLPKLSLIKRWAYHFIECYEKNPSETISSIVLADLAHPLLSHPFNVAIYSMLMGFSLRLPRQQIAELGVAAFLHDLGHAFSGASIPPKHHSKRAFKFMLKQRGFSDAKIKRLLVAYEHHQDRTDNPENAKPILFSRIVRIADIYDSLILNLTKDQPLNPHEALKALWNDRQQLLDPLILQALINQLGYYPPRTVFQLEGDTLALSLGFDLEKRSFQNPKLLIIQSSSKDHIVGSISNLQQYQHFKIIDDAYNFSEKYYPIISQALRHFFLQ